MFNIGDIIVQDNNNIKSYFGIIKKIKPDNYLIKWSDMKYEQEHEILFINNAYILEKEYAKIKQWKQEIKEIINE